MAQVTRLPPDSGAIVKRTSLVDLNGFRNSSFCVSDPGRVASVVVMRPSPTLSLPTHVYEAPTPLAGPSNVTFIVGSSFCHGDHSWKRCRSFTTANTWSGVAAVET